MVKNDKFIDTVSPDTKERAKKCVARIKKKKVRGDRMTEWEEDVKCDLEYMCQIEYKTDDVKDAILNKLVKYIKYEIKAFTNELLRSMLLSDKLHPDQEDIEKLLKERGIE